jgi:hypothetical protein
MNPTAFINLVEGASNAGRDYPDSMGRDVITRKWAEAVKDSLAQDGTQYSGEVGMLGTRITYRVKEMHGITYVTTTRSTSLHWQFLMCVMVPRHGSLVGGAAANS